MTNPVEEIALFIEYAVPAEEKAAAVVFVEKHKDDEILMTLLKEYYTALPHAREEAVQRVVLIDAVQGTFLVGVVSSHHNYLYCADFDNAVLVGEFELGIEEKDVLLFFGYPNNTKFKKALKSVDEYPDFAKRNEDAGVELCPVCSVKEGELHQFGCSVEVCPWCDGQLSNCNCRFEKLGIAEITTEQELEVFEELLVEKGRIPFGKGQGPSYPVAGDDTLEERGEK